MGYKKFQQRGQAALEYMLLLTVVAIVVLIAIKPSSTSRSVLNRAQEDTEGYYNTITEVIMGKNPRPIDGGLCPPKPSGYQECACPQPAFGGAPCTPTSGGPPLTYCGDAVCNGNETGEPGHPIDVSDPLITCFNDCDAMDCSSCATIIPGTQCGVLCGGTTCQGLEVCNASNCSPGCAGYTATCAADAVLCSGACSCTGAWVPLAGCGVPVGSCVPTPFEMCMQNNNCNAFCTPAQTIQARPDPTCGQCLPTATAIPCGPGTVTLPATLNGATANVACPAGCAPGTMSSVCTNGIFGPISNICLPTDCPVTAVSNPDCGGTNLPSVPHGNVGQAPCPNFCGGQFFGTCNLGTYTGITDACIPRPCDATVMTTINCGNVTLPAVGNGVISVAPSCGAGCTGTYSARCSNASFVSVNDQCFRDCSNFPVSAGSCGTDTLPGNTHGNASSIPCPGGCSGTLSATCSNGSFGPVTNTCGCPSTPVNTGACGTTNLPPVANGAPGSIGCPGGCSGTVTGTCTGGTYTGISNTCQLACPNTPVSGGSCGSATLLGVPSGSPSSVPCPGGCSGTLSATCSNGSFGPVTNTCSCPITPVNTGVCGTVNLPAVANGAPGSIGCNGGCTGSGVSGTCVSGSYTGVSINCTPVYFWNFTVAATILNFTNDQSTTTCYGTTINSVGVSGVGCGNPGTPGSSCTATLQ